MIDQHQKEEKLLEKKVKELEHWQKFNSPDLKEITRLKAEITKLNRN